VDFLLGVSSKKGGSVPKRKRRDDSLEDFGEFNISVRGEENPRSALSWLCKSKSCNSTCASKTTKKKRLERRTVTKGKTRPTRATPGGGIQIEKKSLEARGGQRFSHSKS